MNLYVPGPARQSGDAAATLAVPAVPDPKLAASTFAAPTFAAFALAPSIAEALERARFAEPTPIQAKAIQPALDGRDLIAIAQTGTGKTAAFALPMLQRLALEPRRPEPGRTRMLVLSPTRELATQIADTFRQLGAGLRFTLATIFGGVGEGPQIAACARGIDVLVATPGRLVELIERGALKLDRTEIFVLDEADRMLDLGFIRDVKKMLRHLPKRRQSMMFSATMPPAIREIAEAMLAEPVRIAVTPEIVTVERIRQLIVQVPAAAKRQVLVELLRDPACERVIVFCRTKAGANRVAEHLAKAGVGAAAIHGNKSQNARERALAAFKAGGAPVLVATDLASRGIDAPGVTHVINFDLPVDAESYVHRIGRSARAGRDGVAISLCAPEERPQLKQIEKLTRVRIEPMEVAGLALPAEGAQHRPAPPQRQEPRRQGRNQRPAREDARPPQQDARPARQGERPAQPDRAEGADDRKASGRPPGRRRRPHKGGAGQGPARAKASGARPDQRPATAEGRKPWESWGRRPR